MNSLLLAIEKHIKIAAGMIIKDGEILYPVAGFSFCAGGSASAGSASTGGAAVLAAVAEETGEYAVFSLIIGCTVVITEEDE